MQQRCYGNLRRLVTEKCDIMNSIALDDLTMLEELRLKFVENVESIKYAKQPQICPPAFTSLTIIELGDCPELVSFPQGGLHAPNLKEFDIQDCEKLRSLPKHMNNLLPSLQSLRGGSYFHDWRKLELFPTWEIAFKSNITYYFEIWKALCTFVCTSTFLKNQMHNEVLGGSLHFLGLENVLNVEDVLAAKLKNMNYLIELEFSWGFMSGCPKNHEEILFGLQPHTNIKFLRINSWGGENFPNWDGDHKVSNLEQIQLLGCDEFYHGGSSEAMPFRCLEHLQIFHMLVCKGWSFVGGDFRHSFPQLKQLVLKACPELTGELCLPETMETIEILGCQKLDLNFAESHPYKSLTKLHIFGSCSSPRCICLDYFPNLNELHLECENLESLVYSEKYCPALPFLRCLKLTKCPKLERFPPGGMHAANLEDFHIHSCNNLKSLPEQMPSLLSSLQTLTAVSFLGELLCKLF
ncbi:hypothetical protein FEM48_Zijuj05G0184600 [Ziziphus jujuba var. spinosa]|uniref:R13L1/DRL21-like LRR repeat region domain-containing protein n=1 Tax=Ziziphus jujuba var. spinosa TaxID=714518 RepID=A0A978VGF5_ZIZJJ|nr:hypothetical protein FEM48_Zijuj05G0184600 [Ziziphus jujuba var. spinosa]